MLEGAAISASLNPHSLSVLPRPILAWEPYLTSHPDQRFAAFLRRGLSGGFHIGFTAGSPLKAANGNMGSVAANPATVSRYIENEVAAGRLAPVNPSAVSHISPMGIIPKPNQPGKFRLIVDLSAPQGACVNEGISSDLCSLSYSSVDKAVELIRRRGKGCLMAKLDLQSAYRQVPVHPDDQPLLCIEWQGVVYVDRALPFGLRSAPKLFTAVADGLSWALACEGLSDFIHYLDDFFLCAAPPAAICASHLNLAVSVCQNLGFPVAPSKVEGPSTVLTFLGIEIDSSAQELRLPAEKLRRLNSMLAEWLRKRSATKRELQSLIGLLNHAATVVPPGRTFIRQIIETMKIPRKQFQRVRLNTHCRADIAWWSSFVSDWNGIRMFPVWRPGPTVVSDASGSWGCGAFCLPSTEWFQLQWSPEWQSLHISAKELLPVVVSAAIWGEQWEGQSVRFLSDNQATVSVLVGRTARDAHMCHLLRCLVFLEAKYEFGYRAEHIPGRDNKAADALSRDNLSVFFSLHPQAPTTHTVLPPSLVELLLDPTITWTSPRWRERFENSCHKA